jgi:hypothetical protein
MRWAKQGICAGVLLTLELRLCCNPLHIFLSVVLEATPLAVDALSNTTQQ